MSKTNVIPQIEAEQAKSEATKKRYLVYVQCVHQLEAEANKASETDNKTEHNDSVAANGGRA